MRRGKGKEERMRGGTEKEENERQRGEEGGTCSRWDGIYKLKDTHTHTRRVAKHIENVKLS